MPVGLVVCGQAQRELQLAGSACHQSAAVPGVAYVQPLQHTSQSCRALLAMLTTVLTLGHSAGVPYMLYLQLAHKGITANRPSVHSSPGNNVRVRGLSAARL